MPTNGSKAIATLLTMPVDVPANKCLSDCANFENVDDRSLFINT